jgi:hypothetical protein
MRVMKSLVMMLCLGVLVLSVPLAARADEWDKETRMTFNQPVEVPGMVLAPGTYVFKLLDSASDRNVVQIFNADESRLYENVLAIPAYRLEPTDKTVVTLEERAEGTPEAVKDWFYPGDNYGQEFVYPKINVTKVAALATQKSTPPEAYVPKAAAPERQASTPATATVQQPAITTSTPKNAPVQIVQATTQPKPSALPAATPAPVPPQKQTPKRLPKTASPVPVLMLIGLLSIAASAGMHVFSKGHV